MEEKDTKENLQPENISEETAAEPKAEATQEVVEKVEVEIKAKETAEETKTEAANDVAAEEKPAEIKKPAAPKKAEAPKSEQSIEAASSQAPFERPRRGKKRKIETADAPPASEWKEHVVQIRRVTKVVKGGKKLSFRAVVVVGNQKGQVGVGCAKAAEVITAIQKAIADGRKNLVDVPIFKTTIPHPITGKFGAGCVILRPASQGTGVIAGGAVRAVLESAGIENILSKSLGSKSPLNAASATIEALKSLRNFKTVAERRGLTLTKMFN